MLFRQDTAVSGASAPVADETILPPSQSVQKTDSSAASKENEQTADTPFISLSADLVTALQSDEEQEIKSDRPPETKATEVPERKSEAPDSGLSEAEEAQVDALKERDQEVRTHEQAHATTGGQYAGGPSYEYETGPDGQQYAVGGEVQIDTAAIPGDPAATLAKMDTVIKAALAPANPSGQDKAVAAAASQKKVEAQAELNAMKQAERMGDPVPEEVAAAPHIEGQNSSIDDSGAPTVEASNAVINLFA